MWKTVDATFLEFAKKSKDEVINNSPCETTHGDLDIFEIQTALAKSKSSAQRRKTKLKRRHLQRLNNITGVEKVSVQSSSPADSSDLPQTSSLDPLQVALLIQMPQYDITRSATELDFFLGMPATGRSLTDFLYEHDVDAFDQAIQDLMQRKDRGSSRCVGEFCFCPTNTQEICFRARCCIFALEPFIMSVSLDCFTILSVATHSNSERQSAHIQL